MQPQVKQVSAFGNGNVGTVVRKVGDGTYHWVRTAGRLRAAPLWAAPAPVLRALSSASTDRLEVAVVETIDNTQHFRLPGPSSVAFDVLFKRVEPEEFTVLLRETGRVVRRVHDLPPVEGFDEPPALLVGLASWLATGRGPRDAHTLHTLAFDRLGSRRWQRLRRWCDDLVGDVGTRRLLHGAVGIGQVVPWPGHDRASLLAGTHTGVGAPAWDLGSCLGQLLELRETGRRGFAGRPPDSDYGALAAAFLAGYGNVADPVAVGHAAVLTCLNHLRMFVTYGTWHDDVALHVDLVRDLVDEEGGSALRGGAWATAPVTDGDRPSAVR
ncbi:hypothetical protein [Streptomyces sp. NRRL S-920]|uniref:hypothetical protein n=1 Tax=Streptomyces sp. NRRL S-920 TaxID=1463921 RepID=UPI000B16BF7E|nr:hypothetical protein [Streptomyces sp. NRRL S-920]